MKVFLQSQRENPIFPSVNWAKTCILSKIGIILTCFLFLMSTASCASKDIKTPISKTEFYFDTIVSVQIYDKKQDYLLDECMNLCEKYENIFSKTAPESELYQLNARKLPKNPDGSFTISPELYEVIKQGLAYTEKSDGSFSITLGKVTALWDFSGSTTPTLPEKRKIKDAISHTDSKNITLEDNNRIFIYDDALILDLGGIAKGYIADRLKEYLISEGVNSAIIDLGGNLLCIGQKGNHPFHIGIQRPFADRSETIATMQIQNKSVVSSGIYERFFESEGQLYHHIINPQTGYPYENDLIAVTIVADTSIQADALSTLTFSLGYEKGLEFIESQPDADAVFIKTDGSIHYSTDFIKKYQVQD